WVTSRARTMRRRSGDRNGRRGAGAGGYGAEIAAAGHAGGPGGAGGGGGAASTDHRPTREAGGSSRGGEAGGAGGPARTWASAAALSAPATRNRTWRAALIAGAVSVIRVVVPWTSGEVTGLATTQCAVSPSAGLPGNSEAVWPSGPIPSSTTSNRGGAPS